MEVLHVGKDTLTILLTSNVNVGCVDWPDSVSVAVRSQGTQDEVPLITLLCGTPSLYMFHSELRTGPTLIHARKPRPHVNSRMYCAEISFQLQTHASCMSEHGRHSWMCGGWLRPISMGVL
jgi:hypothetical protein